MIRTVLDLLPARSRRPLGLHLVLTVVSVVLRAAAAVLLVPLVAALVGDDPAAAWPWLGALALATLAGWIVDWAVSRLGFELGFTLLDTAQHRVADRLTRVRLTWFTAEHTSAARQAIAATGPELVGIVVYLFTPLAAAVLLPVAIGLGLLPIAWPLGVAALVGVPILLGAFWAAGALGRGADRASAASNAELTERIVEFARTQEALRAARRVEPARSHAGIAVRASAAASLRLLAMQVPGQLLFAIASQVALLLLAGTTVVLAVRGTIGVPEAIALIVVIVRYLEPFTALGELAPGIESATTTLGYIRTVLAAPTLGDASGEPGEAREAGDSGTGDAPSGARAHPDAPPRLELRGVRFAYGDDATPVLDGLDLRLEPGTTTAIVGPSGSGKSTVLGLLAGLYEPEGGAVLVDGVDARDLDHEARRSVSAVVFQQPYLFDGTVRENVLVGRPGADETELEVAGRLARVDGVVEHLADGWGTRVGEGGESLSGGERQRVSIARALITRAPVLLVDEATSALDTENEAAVVAALTDDPTPRTRVIVAHRLASIRAADRVVFLERGRIVEDGPIDELLAAGGRFAEFWRQQDDAAAWRIGARDAG